MEVVNVSGLKNNPTGALRKSHEAPVVVMTRDRPDALILGLNDAGELEAPGVKVALATALFRDGHLSLVRAARLAEFATADFARHLSRLGIPVVDLNGTEAGHDMDTLDEWLASS